MKKRKKMGTQINERDRKLFLYLYQNKLASLKKIRRDVFSNVSRQIVERRLNRLYGKKLLIRDFYNDGQVSVKTHSITEKAFNLFLSEKFQKRTREQFQSYCPIHDLALVDIRHCFEKKQSVKNYITENILQSGVDLPDKDILVSLMENNPDAVLKMELEKRPFIFCLEYDSSVKSLSRYEDVLKKYYYDANVEAVFFIHKEKESFNKLISLEKRIFSKRTPKFYHALLDEILSKGKKMSFVSFKNSLLSFD